MKKHLAACLFALAALPLTAQAQGVALKTENGGELGMEVSYIRHEQADGMLISGRKLGLVATMTESLSNNWSARGELRYASFGSAQMTGSPILGDKGNNKSHIMELRALGSSEIAGYGMLASLYFGAGFRHAYEDMTGLSSTGVNGYRRENLMLYLPVGLAYGFVIGEAARVVLRGEYDFMFQGYQRNFFADSGTGISNLSSSQTDGHGLRASLSLDTNNWGLTVFMNYWRILESSSSTYLNAGVPTSYVHPDNTTVEIGGTVRLRF